MFTFKTSRYAPGYKLVYIHTNLHHIFRLVKDSFLSEIVSKQQHRHAEIYHKGNIIVKHLMRVLFLPTKTLICYNKRKHNVIFELHTEKL